MRKGKREISQLKFKVLILLREEGPLSKRKIGTYLNVSSSITLDKALLPLINSKYLREEIIMTKDNKKIRKRSIIIDDLGHTFLIDAEKYLYAFLDVEK